MSKAPASTTLDEGSASSLTLLLLTYLTVERQPQGVCGWQLLRAPP